MSRKMIDYQVEGNKISTIDGYKVGGVDEEELNAKIQEATINKQDKLKEPTDGSIRLYNRTDEKGNPYTDIISKVKIAEPKSSVKFHIEARTYEVGEYLSAKFTSRYGPVINKTNRYSPSYRFTDASGIVGLISVASDKDYPTNYGIAEMVIIKGGTVATEHDETVWVDYITIMNAE